MPKETSSLLPTASTAASASPVAQQQRPPATATSVLPSFRTLISDGAVLNNTGSTARDHLANERTYLAWMRTSLALIGASLGLLKWDAVSDVAGYIVATLGVVCLISSTERYFTNMKHLEQGKFVPNVRGILVVVVVIVGAIIGAFVLHFHNDL
mmetsp:Transcript_767/g.1620  ORF Transcript_767/g.1620 Transcript_767/m.1620 type:complete len:154 (+) Transcript_767:265-726(+)|eukprot:CAMPEP_0178469850 /NCGR_PEP_ID=MMETSP0696-20121128/222_1 /TAXON_ID=265572 /ORGANISM="Extubocellulus spinifer, Strain CCMP396" /LENGTH=153 /DNA_ID=CAMNT_0020096931 /DNA_START=152 /DNA_END=613 /DNA_ORIENTATION=-